MKVLGIIPARGGSKGIPRKNLAPVLGQPLLYWTVQTALKAKLLDRVVLSTDDSEIAAVGESLGVEVPFLRPDSLASDRTPTIPVLQDVIRRLGAIDYQCDAVFTLQPTNPLRTVEDIDGAIGLMTERNPDSVIGMTPVGDSHPARMKTVSDDGRVIDPPFAEEYEGQPRQLLPRFFLREGSVYLTKLDVLMERNSLKGEVCLAWEIPAERALNIDDPRDLWMAERMLESLGYHARF